MAFFVTAVRPPAYRRSAEDYVVEALGPTGAVSRGEKRSDLTAEFVQTAVQEGGELCGFVGRIQEPALEVDEHEVVLRAVLDTLIECEQSALAKCKWCVCEDRRVHFAQVASNLRAKAHLGQHITLEVNAGRDLDQLGAVSPSRNTQRSVT